MENKEDQKELLAFLESRLFADPVKTRLIDMTKLELVEITRKKSIKLKRADCSTGKRKGVSFTERLKIMKYLQKTVDVNSKTCYHVADAA